MKRFFFSVAVVALSALPAAAQSFVPMTVTETDVQQLGFLFANNPPMRWNDVTQAWLRDLEQRAQKESAATKAAQEKTLAAPVKH